MFVVIKKSHVLLILIGLLLAAILFSVGMWYGVGLPVANMGDGQKTVMLDPGHGGPDPGAVSEYSGIKEKDINLDIALKVKELLEKENFKVIMTRSEDILQYTSENSGITQKRREDLLRRKEMMDSGDADIVVSIHLNKFPQSRYRGAQVFFPPDSAESRKLAGSLQKSLKSTVDPENNREAILKKEPIIILKNSKTTTAVVECGFLSNPEEDRLLATHDYQEKLALGIKNGISNYFKGE